MVTHDVDEAIVLSDRVVMMTNGPEARVGDILPVPIPRPRHRAQLLDDLEYNRCREHLIQFLEERSNHQPTSPVPSEPDLISGSDFPFTPNIVASHEPPVAAPFS